jgi:hypothetical protein
MTDDDLRGSLLNLAPADLEVLASLLEALVPGELAGSPRWAEGWHACCGAIRVVATTQRSEEANPP